MVAVIFIGDLIYCPYLKKYEEILIKNSVEYEVLYWNRSGFEEDIENSKYVGFEKKSKLKKAPIFKIKDFMDFRNWLLEIISKKQYEKIILLTTLSGMIIADVVLRKYPKKYIYDIRDYSYEKIKLYYLLEKKLIENAKFTTISSKGFKHFLPKNKDYVLFHNISVEDLKQERKFKKNETGKLNFVWMGVMRFFDHQKKVIEKLDKDGRFNIIFHGAGPELEEFQNFVKRRKLKNVYFTGKYRNGDKIKLLENADIINNSYAINFETKYAVSNKFYDGAIFHIPQLVECNSYKEQILKEYPIGVALDVDGEDFAERLYQYYKSIKEKEFDEICNTLLHKFKIEESDCWGKIEQFMRE